MSREPVDRARSQRWAIASLGGAGCVVGYSVFTLLNRMNGREHQLHITSGGLTTIFGVAGGGPPSYTMFQTRRPLAFADFNGLAVRLTVGNFGLLWGYAVVYLTLWEGSAYWSDQLAYVRMGGAGPMIPGGSVAHGLTKVVYGSGTRLGSGARSGAVPLELNLPTDDTPRSERLQRFRVTAKETGTIVIPNEILFDFDSYSIKPDARETLTYLANLLNNRATAPVEIEGHTDSVGSDRYNTELSRKRAAAVKQWFMSHHVDRPGEIQITPVGEREPIAPNRNPDGSDNPAGRRMNRRVVIRAHWNL
jgi:outer membrane protein OmpA-like peptidoglycan-associated protein